jgi:hypothetical protein
MKKLIRLSVFAMLVATFAVPALAQTTPSTTTATPAAGQDDTEAKTKLYETFTANRNTNPPVAYEAGKEYLQKYEAKDGPEDQYVKYIKKWVDSYDKIARRNQLLQQIKEKKYNEAFAVGRQVLNDFPDDLALLYELAKSGLFAAEAENRANDADAANYARKTIQLIQAGKTFEKDKPIANKDEILGGLNYALGFLTQKTQPGEAINYYISSTQYEGFAKKNPWTYIFLADLYETSEYARLSNQYKTSCTTEEQISSQTCVDLKSKADQVIDRMIDALARGIAYSNMSPDAAKFAQARTTWTEQLTTYYKYRNNGSDAGLKELIAGITSKPVPKPGEPAAPVTPSSSAAPSGTTSTTPSGTTSTTAKPANTTTTTPAQPSGKTSSTKTTP